MQSLRDKLIKAGLVSKEQAERADREKSKPAAQPAPGGPSRRGPTPSPTKKEEDTRVGQRLTSLKQRQLETRLRELARATEVTIEPGERPFYFQTRKGKLRRLELSEAQANLLEVGRLAVVERLEPAGIEHSLVPPQTAEEMLKLSPKSVRFFARTSAPIGCTPEVGEDHHPR